MRYTACEAAGIGNEVAPVTDDYGVACEPPPEFAVEPARIDRGVGRGKVGLVVRSALHFLGTQPLAPTCRSRPGARRIGERFEDRAEVPGHCTGEFDIGCNLRSVLTKVHHPGGPEPAVTEAEIDRSAGHEHQIGLSQCGRARPGEGEMMVGGKRPPAHPIHHNRDLKIFGESAERRLRF